MKIHAQENLLFTCCIVAALCVLFIFLSLF